MIRFERFYCLLADARECRDFDEFCRECGSTTGVEDVPQALRLLRAAWTMGHEGLTMEGIIQVGEQSLLALSREYGLPYRTAQNWRLGTASPSVWKLPLVGYAVLSGEDVGGSMIPYLDFRRLLTDVSEVGNFDAYVAEVGGSVPLDDVEDVLRLLRLTWALGHDGLTIRKIAEVCDISMRWLAMEYGIPTRTVESWAAGVRNPPEWQLPLIAYAALSDHLDA